MSYLSYNFGMFPQYRPFTVCLSVSDMYYNRAKAGSKQILQINITQIENLPSTKSEPPANLLFVCLFEARLAKVEVIRDRTAFISY